jgi:putative transcriptional regulator
MRESKSNSGITIMALPLHSLQGKFILDAGGLTGSFFSRTVTLICRHNEEGAFGLTLNRLSGSCMGEAVLADLPDTIQEEPVFLGGPVQASVMTFLFQDNTLDEFDSGLPGLGIGNSLDQLIELAGKDGFPQGQVRVFSGYAGWSPGQLEQEVAGNSWIVLPGSVDIVLKAPVQNLWSNLLKQQGVWEWELLAQSPEDPSLN